MCNFSIVKGGFEAVYDNKIHSSLSFLFLIVQNEFHPDHEISQAHMARFLQYSVHLHQYPFVLLEAVARPLAIYQVHQEISCGTCKSKFVGSVYKI